MAGNLILVDTSILIDYYRKTVKENSTWISLVRQGYSFAISSVTKYEIFSGASKSQLSFWQNVLDAIYIIPLDEKCVDMAISINIGLKKRRKQIDLADLFIGATALANGLSIATLNKRHFERIEKLTIVG